VITAKASSLSFCRLYSTVPPSRRFNYTPARWPRPGTSIVKSLVELHGVRWTYTVLVKAGIDFLCSAAHRSLQRQGVEEALVSLPAPGNHSSPELTGLRISLWTMRPMHGPLHAECWKSAAPTSSR